MVKFKESYEKRYEELLGKEYALFKECIVKPLPASIRVNTLKIDRKKLIKRFEEEYGWKLKQVPFYEDGYVFQTKKPVVLGNTLEHFLGYFYMQEVASMIPPVVLNPKPGEVVLDMAAAPGSKTTQMAQMMKNEGVIVANEKTISRLAALRNNLQRCGVLNVIITQMDGRKFKDIEYKFDKVLLDAPCTGTGAIMKSLHTLKIWNVKASIMLSNIQKQLIRAAYNVLKPGGTLVYSTCSLEPEEDEEVIDYAIRKVGFSIEKFKLKGFKTRNGILNWGKKEFTEEVKYAQRVYPQDNNTEGFFIAKLRR